MPLINTTPTKQLSSCDASEGAAFNTSSAGCDFFITNLSPLSGITNIEYEFTLGATVVDTVNTTDTIYEWEPASLYTSESLSIKQTITATLGTYSVTEVVIMPDMSACNLDFQSNIGAGDTFSPNITNSPATNTYWRLADNTVVGPTQNPSGLGSSFGFDGSTYDCKMTSGDVTVFLSPDFRNDDIVGLFDISKFPNALDVDLRNSADLTSFNALNVSTLREVNFNGTGLSGVQDYSTNPDLRSITLSNSSSVTGTTLNKTQKVLEDYFIINCGFTGAFTDLENIDLADNANLQLYNNDHTSASFSGSTGILQILWLTGTGGNYSGSLDISMFTWDGAADTGSQFRINGESGMTSVVHGSGGGMYRYWANSTGISGVQDLSMFTPRNAEASYRFHATAVTGVTLNSTGSGEFEEFWAYTLTGGALTPVDFQNNTIATNADIQFQSAGMSTAQVNEQLVNIRDVAATSSATGSVNIGGGSNGAPDGSSGGFDGTTAVSDLISYGYTVTTS